MIIHGIAPRFACSIYRYYASLKARFSLPKVFHLLVHVGVFSHKHVAHSLTVHRLLMMK